MPWLTLSGSNYSYLGQICIVPKMFEPLGFDCIFYSVHIHPLLKRGLFKRERIRSQEQILFFKSRQNNFDRVVYLDSVLVPIKMFDLTYNWTVKPENVPSVMCAQRRLKISLCSLIRLFSVRIKKRCILGYSKCTEWSETSVGAIFLMLPLNC